MTTEFSSSIEAAISEQLTRVGKLIIGIYISSMQRTTIAEVLSLLLRSVDINKAEIIVYYADAEFTPPLQFPPVRESSPIHPYFCALPLWPERPTRLILGLGYEGGRGIAAMEEFEASRGWLFLAQGDDAQYESSVRNENEFIIEKGNFPLVYYNISEPVELIALLSKVISDSRNGGRPIIVPFGPKIFTFCSLIASQNFPGEVTIWRMSGGIADALSDRIATGNVLRLELELSRHHETTV